MPRLTRSVTDLARIGPVLNISVEPILTVQEIMRRSGITVPSIEIRALIDTGASGSAVQAIVFDNFDMEQVGEYAMNTPSTTKPIFVPKYRVRLVLSNSVSFETYVAAVPMGGQHIQGLLGRDILEQCVLTYNGPKNSFTLRVHNDSE